MKSIVKLIVNIFSNLLNPSRLCVCRFEPSCSKYADQAIDLHGAVRGTHFTFSRLIKCHPWGTFGFDPVPAPKNSIEWKGPRWKSAR